MLKAVTYKTTPNPNEEYWIKLKTFFPIAYVSSSINLILLLLLLYKSGIIIIVLLLLYCTVSPVHRSQRSLGREEM
jgi:hypothetical protein